MKPAPDGNSQVYAKVNGKKNARAAVESLLAAAGIQIDGDRPWDIAVHDPGFYPRLLSGGSLALGESYMDGWWDCEALDQFFDRILSGNLDDRAKKDFRVLTLAIMSRVFNVQKKSRAFIVGKRHYDIGNDLYQAMLDRNMAYSCGYWAKADNLDEAQDAKLELICRKIGLGPGMRVLDIGCGWGSFVQYAAERYGAEVVGITVSAEQEKLAKERCRNAPATILLRDYRDLDESFDHIVSVGMFEHVGYKNYRTFMEIVHRCLAPDGKLLLHTIGRNTSAHRTDPWMNKYIFPNSMLPSATQMAQASEGLFVIRDWHNFGFHYDRTLMCWHENFIRNWDGLKGRYDDRFYRMWNYYLLSCAATFRSGRNQVWQIVLTPKGSRRDYVSVR